MEQKTAVNYLVKEFSDLLGPITTTYMQDMLIGDAVIRAQKMEKKQMLGFYKWVKQMDTPENAERFFHYSDEDVLNEYLDSKKD